MLADVPNLTGVALSFAYELGRLFEKGASVTPSAPAGKPSASQPLCLEGNVAASVPVPVSAR